MFTQQSHVLEFPTVRLNRLSKTNTAVWMTMAFQAGVINVGGFLACHRFVSHVTGFATFFGVELGQRNFMAALGMLTVPLFFIFGAMISAFVIDHRILKGKNPWYPVSFAIITLAMIYVTVAGSLDQFGVFGAAAEVSSDYLLLALLCLSSGMQNATVTSASGAVIRTTHLTGITTDFGIGLVRTLTEGLSPEVQQREAKTNRIRLGLIGSFILGSSAGAFLFLHFQYLGFLGPALISFVLTLFAYRRSRHLRALHD